VSLKQFQCPGCHLDTRPCFQPEECKEMGVCAGRNPACAEWEKVVDYKEPPRKPQLVLVISSWEDHKSGLHTAVVEIPTGWSDEDTFRLWYNDTHKSNHTLEEMTKEHYFMHGFERSTVCHVH
jgi:hypothetical protein